MEPKPTPEGSKQEEIEKMRGVVSEAINRMMDAPGENTDEIMTLTAGEPDLSVLERLFAEREPELNDQEKFYLKSKIYLMQLEQQ